MIFSSSAVDNRNSTERNNSTVRINLISSYLRLNTEHLPKQKNLWRKKKRLFQVNVDFERFSEADIYISEV